MFITLTEYAVNDDNDDDDDDDEIAYFTVC